MERPPPSARPPQPPSAKAGQAAEAAAQRFLEGHGLQTFCCNYRCREGEIDLVMEQGKLLVFAEVRLRRHQSFGGAAASVTLAKQQKIIASAGAFLHHHPQFSHHDCRFDVVAVQHSPQGWQIEWLPAAFTL